MSSIIRATTTSGLQVAPDNSGSLQLQTNGTTTAVTIDTSQNVGIGTASPTVKLQVNGDVKTGNGVDIGLADANNTIVNIGNGATGNKFALTDYIGDTTYTDFGLRVGRANDGANGTSQIQHRGTGALSIGAFDAGVVNFYTSNTERMRIDTSGYVTNAVNGLGNGIVQAQQYYRLNSTVAGANATGAQSLFGVGVTLIGSTVYEFEIMFMLSKTAGLTSHNVSISFGGTATLNNIGYFAVGTDNSTAISGRGGGTSGAFISSITASAVAFTGAISTATSTVSFIIKGTVSINAGGTFIPQYTLSAAPGGAYTTQAGSYIKIAPLAASGANVSIGSWA